MITAGIHPNFPIDEYYNDPCPAPSLSQSIAKVLLDKSPAHARIHHPRLNPSRAEEQDKKFDLGSVAHRLLLGRGRDIEVCQYDDWRTKAAKESRDAAISAGRLPALAKDYERAARMVDEVKADLTGRGFAEDWFEGYVNPAELMIVAEIGGVWCRALVDWMPFTRRPWDYKTTSRSAAPHEMSRRMTSDGWHIQAAFQERILDEIDPANAGRREHLFVVQENYEPFALSIVRIPEAAMTVGRRDVDRAIRIWGECLASGKWPAYTTETLAPEMPAWFAQQALEREENDHE